MIVNVNKLKVHLIVLFLILTVGTVVIVAISHAGTEPPQEVISSKDVILVLFGLLQTGLLALAVWLINNDRELFVRVGKMETSQASREAICEERNKNGEYHHQRASDAPEQKPQHSNLQDVIDLLRKELYAQQIARGCK